MRTKKTTEQTPILIYKDESFETRMRDELSQAQKALQKLIDAWNALDLDVVPDLHELLLRPDIVFKSAVEQIAQVPETTGRFSINKEKYLENLNLPDPSKVYTAAKTAQRQPFASLEPFWYVEEKEVKLNEDEAKSLVESRNIYLSDEKLIAFTEKLKSFVELSNELDDILKGELLQSPRIHQHYAGKFLMIGDQGNHFKLAIDPEALRTWLQSL